MRVPMLQINERARYTGLPSVSPDFQQPGLVVDLARRLEAKDLLRCFSQVTLARDLTRGALGLAPGTRYQAFVVAEPRVDVLRDGCPEDPAKRRRR